MIKFPKTKKYGQKTAAEDDFLHFSHGRRHPNKFFFQPSTQLPPVISPNPAQPTTQLPPVPQLHPAPPPSQVTQTRNPTPLPPLMPAPARTSRPTNSPTLPQTTSDGFTEIRTRSSSKRRLNQGSPPPGPQPPSKSAKPVTDPEPPANRFSPLKEQEA